jgi:hypothetical protein
VRRIEKGAAEAAPFFSSQLADLRKRLVLPFHEFRLAPMPHGDPEWSERSAYCDSSNEVEHYRLLN